MTHFDLMLHNGTVLTLDEPGTVIEDGVLGIQGDTIAYVGTDPTAHSADRFIDADRGLLLPGLVNAHTHAAMSLFRGLADDLPLMKWLNDYIFPVESRMDADFVFAGTLLACAEMIRSGTTTFCDMYLFESEVAAAARQAGMRCLIGEVLFDFPSPNYGSVENGLAYTKSLISQWQDDPLISVAVEPHSLFTCGPELLKSANALALEQGVPLITHLAETEQEVAHVRETYGKGPVAHLDALGVLGPHLIADHCVHLDSSDIDALARHGVKAVHNPESNMKLASGIAPVPELLNAGVTVGLGTDGCASNNNLDLFGEMDMAAKLHKVNTLDPTVMDAETVLRMATIHGARALGLDAVTGSLEPGKKADIIVVDVNKPHLVPLYNAYSQLVYAAKGDDVRDCIINGRVVMENRELLTLSLEEILFQAGEKSAQVKTWLP